MFKGKILVVDDDAFFRALCSDILTTNGFAAKTASTGREALRLLEHEQVDIVITDLVMPDLDGIEVLKGAKQINALMDVIMVTGHGTIETAIEALKNGASDYIRKPLNEDELLHTVYACMEKKALLEENQEMRQSLRLFEVSRAITSTLDINKLYNLSLDAMLQVLPGDAGVIIFSEGEKTKLEVKASRHLGAPEGEKLLDAFRHGFEKDPKVLDSITIFAKGEVKGAGLEALKDYHSILVAPVVKSKEMAGYVIVLSKLSKSGYSIRDLKNASFIAEHSVQAFENAMKYSEAKEMAFLDSLTNLYNSKYLESALDKELKRADRLMMPVTILFLDLDNFKLINDKNDHLVGSKVLVEVGKVLMKCVREVDTVIRYGGDEFVVILVDAEYDVAMRVAERIRSSIEKHRFLADEGLDIRVTVSIGVATYPIHTRDKKELLKIADKAMYRAKDISRNVIYLAPVPGAKEAN